MILSDSVSFNAMLQSYKISNEVPEPPNWGWNLSALHVWKPVYIACMETMLDVNRQTLLACGILSTCSFLWISGGLSMLSL
jgi:hypothetical protein